MFEFTGWFLDLFVCIASVKKKKICNELHVESLVLPHDRAPCVDSLPLALRLLGIARRRIARTLKEINRKTCALCLCCLSNVVKGAWSHLPSGPGRDKTARFMGPRCTKNIQKNTFSVTRPSIRFWPSRGFRSTQRVSLGKF